MRNNSITVTFIRTLTSIAIAFFLGMLYWSYSVQEETLQQIKSELVKLSKNLSKKSFAEKQNPPETALKSAIAGDNTYPNLLQTDPFYETVLPKILGPNFTPHGMLTEETIGRPDNMHPFSEWSNVRTWLALCNVTAATSQFGIFETFAPEMAYKIEERPLADGSAVEFRVYLKEGVFWQPLEKRFFQDGFLLADSFLEPHPVTAHDFKFNFDCAMNPFNQTTSAAALRNFYDDVIDFKVIDDLTFSVIWKAHELQEGGQSVKKIKYIAKMLTGGLNPLPEFVFGFFADGKPILENKNSPHPYRESSVFAQNFNEHWAKNIIIGCGPWLFDGMDDRQIRLKRNPYFYNQNAALFEEQTINFKTTTESIWQDFKAGKLYAHSLQPDQLREFAAFLKSPEYAEQKNQQMAIEQLDFVSRAFAFIGWNAATPYFSSAKVRVAMTHAIDRQRIIEQNLNGLGIEINGPFYRYSPSYNDAIEPWPFDLQKARQLLAEEGWYDSDGDGIIDKKINGKKVPFQFSLTYYVKNLLSKSICETIATSLKQIGIDCRLKGVDVADLSASFDDKSFDALFLTWVLGTPPEDLEQLWSSKGAKEKGSSNAVGFANKQADEIIEILQYESDVQKRNELYHTFGKIMHEEQPYTFLYTPKVRLLYREKLQNVFLPVDRQDLIPGANVAEPSSSIYYLKN